MSILLVNVPPLFSISETLVSNDITEDTTWVVASSPYVIISNIRVKKEATLTIEPGVTVRFNENVSLIVEGNLFAVGTSLSRITFTSNQPNPIYREWAGLRFVGENTDSFILKYVCITYAKNGITVESLGKAVIEKSEIVNNSLSGINVIGQGNVVIKENNIKQNENGVSTAGGACSGLEIANNHISSNSENGIYLYSSGATDCRIYNLTIQNNHISENGNGIYIFSNAGTENAEADIYGVTILDNTVSSNSYGVRLRTHGWYAGYIYNLKISNNTVFINDEGIDLYSGSNWYSWISNVTISKNKIFANKNGISLNGFRLCVPYDPFKDLPFDVTVTGNIISANDNKGINVIGDVRTNLTDNSVSYNSYGIYITTRDNCAFNNDIYQNSLYGIYIENNIEAIQAEIKAERNYWGASNGPYHEDLNPDGLGDQVNGNGENLDFEPFLTAPVGYINEAPVAKLQAYETAIVNRTVSFNASASTDDLLVDRYFFDFGDGENSGWTTIPTAKHIYSSPRMYNATLVVMDEFGVKSNNTSIVAIMVVQPSLVIDISLNSVSVISQGQVVVKVHVSDGLVSVKEALVQLMADKGGDFAPHLGYTDSNGYFNATYCAPSMSGSTNIRITATASKEGYRSVSENASLSVVSAPSGIEFDTRLIWFAAITAVILVAVIVVLRKKKT